MTILTFVFTQLLDIEMKTRLLITTTLLITTAMLLASKGQIHAGVITIKAFDTASPRHGSGTDVNNDNRLRAYNSGSTRIDGFMGFDLSAIPDTATIDSITLNLYSEGLYGTPQGSPALRVYRSVFDGWSRGGSGFPGVLDEALTSVDYGPFPPVAGTPYSFSLDTAPVNWQTDLVDNQVSLALRTENTTAYNCTYWFGSDNPANAPVLTISFSQVPEPASFAIFGTICLVACGRRRKR